MHLNIHIPDKHNKGWFVCFAVRVAHLSGNPYTFLTACLVLIIWGLTGPLFGYSDTWQLVINTATSVITFLMVFIIQNTQNRDSRAMHLKLDELIRATEGAHTILLDLEELKDSELERISQRYLEIAEVARERLRSGKKDTSIPKVILDEPIAKK